ncbi:MAG: hypothetical protein ACRDKI_01040 [Solirubrobacterales bacterium]
MAKQQRSKRRKPLGELAKQREVSAAERLELEKKMCGEKRRFALKDEAERLAAEYGLGIYQCPVCGGWHFTSKPESSD